MLSRSVPMQNARAMFRPEFTRSMEFSVSDGEHTQAENDANRWAADCSKGYLENESRLAL